MQYLLCRIEDDSSISLVSEHADIVSGVAEGKRVVAEDDFDFAYCLLTDDSCRLTIFAKGRIQRVVMRLTHIASWKHESVL
jgi:hypothetical protein